MNHCFPPSTSVKARRSSGCSVRHVVASCTETHEWVGSPACIQTLSSESRSHTPSRPQSGVRGAPPPSAWVTCTLTYHSPAAAVPPQRLRASLETQSSALSFCVCVWAATVEFTVLDFSSSASKQAGDKYRLSAAGLIVGLWWQADASRCLTPWASPSGKHHCEFLRGGKSDFVFCFFSVFLCVLTAARVFLCKCFPTRQILWALLWLRVGLKEVLVSITMC